MKRCLMLRWLGSLKRSQSSIKTSGDKADRRAIADYSVLSRVPNVAEAF